MKNFIKINVMYGGILGLILLNFTQYEIYAQYASNILSVVAVIMFLLGIGMFGALFAINTADDLTKLKVDHGDMATSRLCMMIYLFSSAILSFALGWIWTGLSFGLLWMGVIILQRVVRDGEFRGGKLSIKTPK